MVKPIGAAISVCFQEIYVSRGLPDTYDFHK